MTHDPRADILESDINTLLKLIVSHKKPLTEGDIRAASNILRRWICEGLIGQFCNELQVQPTFPVFDNDPIWKALPSRPSVNYFLTAGVRFDGVPLRGIYNSTEPASAAPILPIAEMKQTLVGFGAFKSQKRLYFEGDYFSCEEIINFTANKLGGVHLDAKRNSRQEKLERAAHFMTFGGPLIENDPRAGSELHLMVEPTSKGVFSGLHVEIIAAGASFLQIHLDGIPFVEIATKKTLSAKIASYIPFFRRKPAIRLYDSKNSP
ncbi:hypothetical protein [Agrobacterium rosae]|uniref:hypothetical protein n=1 Tax=Agrobacterium rosae TaxID=1972867 RepID=UPI003BA13C46